MGLVRDQQRTLAELVQEVRALNAAVREQDVRLASLEASVGSSANKARPPPTTNKRTPPTTARGDSAVRAAAEPVARSEASGAVDFNQLLLSSRQLTPVDAIQLEGSEEIGAIAISNSLLQRPTPSQPLAGPKFVGVAGTNGSLLVLDSSGRPLTPPVRLPAPAAALAFSPTEPARLWVALPLEAGAFLLHTYSMRSVRPVPSPQREWHAEWAEEPLPLRLSLEHETRLWWGGADDDSRRAADRADAAAGAAATDPAAGAGTGAAAGAAAPSGDKPGASPAPAAAAPPVGIVALLPSLAGVGEGTAKHRPAASPRGRASVLVAWSDGLVSLADPSGGSTSLPTGLATLRAVARSARSLALASADRVLVLDLAQPGSPAFARECALPSWAAGRISDVAFDAQIPSLMYASTTDGHLLFLRTRAPATEHVTGTGRTRGYECVCAETRRDAAPPPAPPIPPPPPPKSSRSWRGAWSERRANRGTAAGEPQEFDVAESTVAAVVWPEVAIASIRGYVLIARAGRLGVLNVSDVYLGADFAAAPIVHDQIIGGASPSLLRAAGSLILLAHSPHAGGGGGSPSVATLLRTSLTYEPPPKPWWLQLVFVGAVLVVTLLYQWCRSGRAGDKRGKGNGDSDGQADEQSPGRAAGYDRAGQHSRYAQPRYAGAPRMAGVRPRAGQSVPYDDFPEDRFD